MAEPTIINCPHCSQAYRMSPENMAKFAGRAMTCKKCQQAFTVPDVEGHGEPEASPTEVAVEQEQPHEVPPPEQHEVPNAFSDEPPDLSGFEEPVGAPAAPPPPNSAGPAASAPPPRIPSRPPVAVAPAPLERVAEDASFEQTGLPGARQRLAQARAGRGMDWGEFLAFRKMITPLFVQIIFWVGVALQFIVGIVMMVTAFTEFGGFHGLNFTMGLLQIIIGPLLVRIGCELLVVVFRINDNLGAIRESLEGRQS